MTRYVRSAFFLAALLLCSLVTAGPATAGPRTVTFNGTFEGGLTIIPLEPPFVRVLVSGGGEDATLGPFILNESFIFDGETMVFTGTSTYAFVSGDRLLGVTSGVFQGSFSATTIIRNGTGRLKKAFGVVFAAGGPDEFGVLHTELSGLLITPNRR